MKFFIFEAWKRARTDEKKDERDEEGRTPDPTPWQAWTEKKAPEAHRSALLPSVPFVKQFSVLAVEPERLETTFRKGFG
jgi:hypothetical protein